MQTDQSIDSATATSRRTFLTRAAVGGALVTAGAVALPHLGLSPAGARPADQGTLKDADFATFGTAVELAAVAAYTAAFDGGLLDTEWSKLALQFQGHHQAVADTLLELSEETEIAADAAFAATSVDAVKAATDQNGVLAALAVVEETCAATHLSAIGVMAEKVTSRTVAQVLCVEGQQAALLGIASGSTIAEVTPRTNTNEAALTIPDESTTTTSTTTTAPAGSTDDSQDPDATPEENDETDTSAPSAND